MKKTKKTLNNVKSIWNLKFSGVGYLKAMMLTAAFAAAADITATSVKLPLKSNNNQIEIMKTIELNIQDAVYFADKQYENLKDESIKALTTLEEGTGAGNDFLGWLDLPSSTSRRTR